MPDLDGYELAAMIRQHPRFQQTSIIFVSAVMLTDLDRLRGYECGAVDYVPVPVVPEILRAKVSVFADLYRKTRALERLNAELEERVDERTAALEATTAALQEADRRKDEFLAMLAHELRNPLAPIRTAVQLLRLKELAEPQRARARDVIERQVEHMVRPGRRPARRVAHHARQDRAAARAACWSARSWPGRWRPPGRPSTRTGTSSTSSCPTSSISRGRRPDPARAGDHQPPAQRRQVHRPGGRIRLTRGPRRPAAVITVADTGIGIAPELLPTIFELFTQVRARSERSQGGLGIGLALVRRLVEMHGGTVTAQSAATATAPSSRCGCRCWPRGLRRADESRCRRRRLPPMCARAASSSPTTTSMPPSRCRCSCSGRP